MRQIEQLLLITTIALASAQQCYAFKKVFRVRPGMPDLVTEVKEMVTSSLEELSNIRMWVTGPIDFIARKCLPVALKNGDFATAKRLWGIVKFCDFYIPSNFYPRLLHKILIKAKDNREYYECVKLLIKIQGDGGLYKRSQSGEYPLDIAFRRKLSRIAVLLIQKTSRANKPYFNERGHSYHLLHYATEYRFFDVITYLVEQYGGRWYRGVDIPDEYGWTALHYAGARGDYSTFKLLFFLGCKPDIKNHDGKTALELWPSGCKKDEYNQLTNLINTCRSVSHCKTEDRYYMGKNLEKTAQKCAPGFNKKSYNDIKIYFKGDLQ